MVNIIWAERKSRVLTSSQLACLARIPSINLTAGCAHDCIYCYARGYSGFPGENKVIIYKNTFDKLKSELFQKRSKPQAVYFSPSSDIFQPVPQLLELSHSLLQFLLSQNIGIALLTKGVIPEKTLRLMLEYTGKLRVQIGFITHDDAIRTIFEPHAASIEKRLEQMARLVDGGVIVEARIVPIIPGVTDSDYSIECLFRALASTGIKRAAISTLFLRPAIVASLKRHIADKKMLEYIMSLFRDVKPIAIHAGRSSVAALSRQMREEIYAHFINEALKHNIVITTCGCMNPDIGGICNIAGKWPQTVIQANMFNKDE